MNILFCGGGTVGHISPAIAIAEEFTKKYPECKIAFIGRYGGNENEVIKKLGYKVYEIKISGLLRRLTLKNLKVIKNALSAEKESLKILKNFKPDAVIGTGGYVCWPVIRAAKRLGILTAIHESNAALGLSSKLLSRKCDIFLLGADVKVKKYNSIYVGNPVRAEFYTTPKDEARRILKIPRDKFLIISVGGSIGAEKLNTACLGMMKIFSSSNDRVYHFHSSGKRYFQLVKAAYPELISFSHGCAVYDYIDKMPLYLAAADLVISRCGAMTLSEIAASKSPSILIPSPNVTADHQTKNALYFVENGASVLINESELSTESLTKTVYVLMQNKEKLNLMSENAFRLSFSDSAKKIVKIIEKGIS